jgi:TetR/AcrR family transcriptional regulator
MKRLRGDLKSWLAAKSAVIEGWMAERRMAPVEPKHLFFAIWAATQTYADLDIQIAALLGRRKLKRGDYRAGADLVTRMVLGVSGLV